MPIEAVPPVDKWVQKMLDRVKNAGPAWEDGIKNPKASPVAGMKAANGKFKARVQAALQNDTWLKKVSLLSDESIQAQALKVGGQKLVDGITARQDKITAAIQRLQPKVASLAGRVRSMPQDTDTQREQRMLENLRGMRAIKTL